MINFTQQQISNPTYNKTTAQSVEGSVVLLGLNAQGQPITFHGDCASAGKQGAQGSTGNQGDSVTVFTFQYYLSTSMTTPTGGTWSNTPPTMEAGKYMWIRPVHKIGSGSYQYGQPCCCGSGAGGGGGTGWDSVTAEMILTKLATGISGSSVLQSSFMTMLSAAAANWNLNINQMTGTNAVTISNSGVVVTDGTHTSTVSATSVSTPEAFYI